MDNQEINKSPNTALIIACIIVFSIGIVISSLVSYKEGCKDTKRLLEEPSITVILVPELGPAQIIPTKLTSKGIGIRFNTLVTNLSAIGIEFSNKK